MKSVRPFGISGRVGLALLAFWPALAVGLSATGERLSLIYVVALLGILPALLGAVTWLKAGQRHPKVFLQKRLVALFCVLTALSVPITHWPLKIALKASLSALNVATKERREYLWGANRCTCGNARGFFRNSLHVPQNLPRIGLWRSSKVVGVEDRQGEFRLCVTLRPGGSQIWYSENTRRWEIYL